MTVKTKPPAPPGGPLTKPPPTAKALPPTLAPENRWQRTVRYGWDKGGAKGGRK